MKAQKLLIYLLTLGFLVLACTRKVGVSSEELRGKINLTIIDWEDLRFSTDLSYESIHSWLPESGIRGRYQIAKKVLSKSVLERIVGEKAFLSGPHESGINYDSRDFGRYNPAFLTKLKGQLSTLYSNKIFIDKVQSFYDKELKQYLRTYYLAYEAGANNQEVMDGYLALLSKEVKSIPQNAFLDEPSYYLQESFREFADSAAAEGYDEYEAFTCPGFWVRRSIDGTADAFYELLVMTMGVFDDGFLASTQKN